MLNSPIKKLVLDSTAESFTKLTFGGIGTGSVSVCPNGAICNFDIEDIPTFTHNPEIFYIIKAQSDSKTAVFLLETEEDSAYSILKDSNNLFSAFEKRNGYVTFPFFKKKFISGNFPGEINFSAWNPFIPNNETDSGIPALLSEYEIRNTADKDITYTIYCIAENTCAFTRNTFCESRRSDIKYLKICNSSANDEISSELCIGVCGENINCTERLICGDSAKLTRIINDYILTGEISDKIPHNEDARCFGIISSSVMLMPGEQSSIKFTTSWYSPYFEKTAGIPEKKYYTRYFSGADECAFYCLSQWQRLYIETDNFRQLLYSSTLSEDVLKKFTLELFSFKGNLFTRAFDGRFHNINYSVICKNSILQAYFPGLVRSLLEQTYLSNTDNSKKRLLFPMLCNYLKTTGNSEFAEKVWKNASEALTINYNKEKNADSSIFKYALKIAKLQKDKKGTAFLEKICSEIDSNCDASNTESSLSVIYDICGLSIDALSGSFSFCPDMEYSYRGVFQCILCFGAFLGFVERGIDYIQIKCIKGSAFVRNIEVPDIPLKVKCGGYEIGFKADCNTAMLDNNCEINPKRDLLVIFRSN